MQDSIDLYVSKNFDKRKKKSLMRPYRKTRGLAGKEKRHRYSR